MILDILDYEEDYHGTKLFPIQYVGITLPETNSSHLKMDGWNTIRFL